MKKNVFLLFCMLSALFCINSFTALAATWEKPGDGYKWVSLWAEDTPMMVPRGSAAVVKYNGYIYAIGGGADVKESNIIHSSVEYSKVLPNGKLSPWKMTSEMKKKRIFAGAIVSNGYVYVIGGEDGYKDENLLDTIERAKIKPDGSLGPWVMEKERMNTPRRGLVAYFHEGWIYAFGGFNGAFLSDIERTKINADGSLQKWSYEVEVSEAERYIHTGVMYKDRVYIFGGHAKSTEAGLNTAEWSNVKSDGTLSEWKPLPLMPTKRFGGGAVILHDIAYIVGGQNTIPVAAVDKAAILPNGMLGEWTQDTPFSKANVGVSLIAVNDVLYAIGGHDGSVYLQAVTRAHYHPEKPLGFWTKEKALIETAEFRKNAMPVDVANHSKAGWQFLNEQRFDKAITEFKLSLEVKDDLADSHYLLGLAYHMSRKFPEAVEEYVKAASLSPKLGSAVLNLANVYYEMKELKKAEEQYIKAIELMPDVPDAKLSFVEMLVENDRCLDARRNLMRLSRKYPNHPKVKELKKTCKL